MVVQRLLSAPSFLRFLAESPEAADSSFQGGIQVLQHARNVPPRTTVM